MPKPRDISEEAVTRYEIIQGIELEKTLCPWCGEMMFGVKERRQNTQYANDGMNYVTCCEDCFMEI